MKIDLSQDYTCIRFTIRKKESEILKAFFERFDISHGSIKIENHKNGDTAIWFARTGFGIALRFLEMLGTTDEGAQGRMNKLYCTLLSVQDYDALGTDVSAEMAQIMRGNNDTLH